MAHPMQHYGDRKSTKKEAVPANGIILKYDESVSSLGVSLSIGQFIEWGVLKVVDHPVYRKHMTDHACDVCRDQSESVYHAGDCWWLVEVGEEPT
jgi:hypothetical protein